MSILVEAITVVLRTSALDALYPGGVEAFEADAPNATYRSDGVICGVGFMSPDEVRRFVDLLTAKGLPLLNDDGAFDEIAIVDQTTGPTAPCDWLTIIESFDGWRAVCLAGTDARGEVAVYDGYEPGLVQFGGSHVAQGGVLRRLRRRLLRPR
jgi:hypothetical protein